MVCKPDIGTEPGSLVNLPGVAAFLLHLPVRLDWLAPKLLQPPCRIKRNVLFEGLVMSVRGVKDGWYKILKPIIPKTLDHGVARGHNGIIRRSETLLRMFQNF